LSDVAGWDACDFEDVRPGSPLLRAALPEVLRAVTAPGAVCPVLAVPAAPGPNLRRNLRRYHDRLSAAAGPLASESAGPGDYAEVLAALFRLHGERWRAAGGPGVLNTAAIQDFHRAAAAGFASRGQLRLHSLRAAGAIVAAVYAFAGHGRVYFYLGGFDPKWKNFSPGTLAIGYAIEEASRDGFREIDFLRGAETYKYAWGAQDTRNYRLVIDRAHGIKAVSLQ
jgi:CelD/BcsL family acetyltransferase involved in cellulose biosynthesis